MTARCGEPHCGWRVEWVTVASRDSRFPKGLGGRSQSCVSGSKNRLTSGCTGARAAETDPFGQRRRAGPVNLDVRRPRVVPDLKAREAALVVEASTR
jgi:hypothetical protein